MRFPKAALLCLCSGLAASCGITDYKAMAALSTPVDKWERYHLAHEDAAVEIYVPPQGQGPPVPQKNQYSSMLSPQLLNLSWGTTRDYAPKLWLVALFMKRTRAPQSVVTAEAFAEEQREIMQRYFADLGSRVDVDLKSWRALEIAGRTWFVLEGLPDVFTYVTPAAPDSFLLLRGTSHDAKDLSAKRQLIESVAAHVTFLSLSPP